MQPDKLNILLQHGFLKEMPEDSDLQTDFAFYIKNKLYLITEKIETILTGIFNLNLEHHKFHGVRLEHYNSYGIRLGDHNFHGLFDLQRIILEKFKLSPAGNKYKIEILNNLLQNEHGNLKKCIGEIRPSNTIELYQSNWASYLLMDSVDLIYSLVFEVARN